MKILDILLEGPNDPHIFKAIFLAGGPGSGKSFVSSKLLGNTGLRVVNSDDIYEYLMTKQGMKLDPETIFSPAGQSTREKAKAITRRKKQSHIDGRLGLIIDGTGKDVDKYAETKNKLEALGYDTMMLFVNTNLNVAQERNLMRPRQLDPQVVEKMWHSVQDNLMAFQQLFGAGNFYLVDNSGGLEDASRAKNFTRVEKAIRQFINSSPQRPEANRWLSAQKPKVNSQKNPVAVKEVFDRPLPIKKTFDGKYHLEYQAKIKRKKIVVEIEQVSSSKYDDAWDVIFSVNGDTHATGAGDQYKIFATVLSAINMFIDERSPDQIEFTSMKEQDGDSPGSTVETGRTNLYTSLVKRFAQKKGYNFKILNDESKAVFILTKMAKNEGIIKEVFDQPSPIQKTVDDAYKVEYTARIKRKKIDIEFEQLEDGVWEVIFYVDQNISVTGKGDQYKIFATVLSAINSFIDERSPDQIEFESLKFYDRYSGTDSGRTKLYISLIKRFAQQKGYMSEIQDTADETTFTLKKIRPTGTEKKIAEVLNTLNYSTPNFEYEWEEALRYPEFRKIGKQAWIELADKGRAVTIRSAKDINNTDAAEPDSFKRLDKTKQSRALDQLKSGTVEMPIVAVYPDGYKELVGGNTRLTAMLAQNGKATVWAFKVPDEVAELAENFADGKKKIQEVFTNPYAINWLSLQKTGESHAEVELPDGSVLDIRFTEIDDGDFDIEFVRNRKIQATGGGDEFRIFATVVKAIKQWWNQMNKDEVFQIMFGASKSDGKEDSKRRNVLYKRFAKQFAQKIGWVATTRETNRAIEFSIIRPEDVADMDLKVIGENAATPITDNDLKRLEFYADKIFRNVGIDIEFTRHFLDRVNDVRNQRQITLPELAVLFRDEYVKWGKKIAQLGPDAQAVMKDMRSDINIPFVLNWDSRNQELDLVAKTVMRKKNFQTPNPEFPVESKNPNQLKGQDRAKTVKPGRAGFQPHPYKGKLVGNGG